MLRKVGKALTTAPEGFHLHKTIARLLEAKAKMFETGEGFDWATGEALAFGTLLDEGSDVRLSGQDSRAAPSASAMPPWSIRKTKNAICPLQPCPRGPGRVRSDRHAAVGRSGAGL